MTAQTQDDIGAASGDAGLVPPDHALPDPNSEPARAAGTARRGRKLRLPIAAVLTLGFGGLMLVAVASVLVMGLVTTGRNTSELLTEKARLLMDGLESRVRSQLDPARAQVEYLARAIIDGEIATDDPEMLGRHLRTALAAAPQITGVGFLTPDSDFVSATRQGGGNAFISVERGVFWGGDTLALARSIGGPVWIDPIWAEGLGTSVMTVQMPVRRDGRFLGVLLTGVSFTDLSRFLSDVKAQAGLDAFILFDDAYVLAHPVLRDRRFDFSAIDERERPPLPTLDELGDPVVGAIWQRVDADGLSTGADRVERGQRVDVTIDPRISDLDLAFRASAVNGREYLYLVKRLPDYGEHPWTLAIAFPEEEVTAEFRRMGRMGATGLGILVVSVLIALWLGRRISRQIKRLARAAVAVRALDLAAVPALPDSRFRELSEASGAFNTMLSGLRWFETYVPKALVLRLIERGARPGAVISEEREVTVMFTDIRGFSARAQALTPQQTADWLNAHFTRVAACIEAEGGTVDKFIGDAVMAFWGAPDHQPDHAARALRAARAIESLIRAEAVEAAATGAPPVSLRVGIHSGPVVVGNIGAASRINYTIVGDTVNTASRLEAMGNDLVVEDCCITLMSADTALAAGADAGTVMPLGPYALRGRSGTLQVYRLA